MVGLASDYSVSALSGRCPRISVPDRAVSPFPATPLRTVHKVLPYTALHRTFARPRSACRVSVPSRASLGNTPSLSNSPPFYRHFLLLRPPPLCWLPVSFLAPPPTTHSPR